MRVKNQLQEPKGFEFPDDIRPVPGILTLTSSTV